jgi:hypothetical protein
METEWYEVTRCKYAARRHLDGLWNRLDSATEVAGRDLLQKAANGAGRALLREVIEEARALTQALSGEELRAAEDVLALAERWLWRAEACAKFLYG